MKDVNEHVVGQGILDQLVYIPKYLTTAEELQLVENVQNSKACWKQVSGRRLQNHGGVVHDKGLLPNKMPSWLGPVLSKLTSDLKESVYGGQPPNHVLVNEYNPGEGIMPHQDGPSYHPGVAIISLAAPAVIRFWRKPEEGAPSYIDEPVASLLLMPRSLLIFSGEAYTHCLHGIRPEAVEDIDKTVVNLGCHQQQLGLNFGSALPRSGTRLSLTVRRVNKVLKNILRLSAS